MLWFIMAGMAALTALAAILPVLRSSPRTIDADPVASEAAFYKAQLEEIQRDVERGVLPQSEAASARAEAARRLISSRSEAPKPAPTSRGGRRVAAAALIAVCSCTFSGRLGLRESASFTSTLSGVFSA